MQFCNFFPTKIQQRALEMNGNTWKSNWAVRSRDADGKYWCGPVVKSHLNHQFHWYTAFDDQLTNLVEPGVDFV